MKKAVSFSLVLTMILSLLVIFPITSAASTKPFVDSVSTKQVMNGMANKTFYRIKNGKKVTISSSTMKYGSNKPYLMQGACTDGEDYYFSLVYKSALEYEKGYILKYDVSAKKYYVSERLPVAHANDLTYNSRTNQIIICNNAPDRRIVTVIKADTLELVKQISLKDDDGDDIHIFSISYDDVNNRYVCSSSFADEQDGVFYNYILDKNFKVTDKHVRKDQLTEEEGAELGYTRQSGDCSSKYIFRVYSGHKNSKITKSEYNVIAATDWNGNVVGRIKVPLKYEAEDVFHIGDTFYVFFHNKDAGGYLYRIGMTSYTIKYNANGGTGTMANSTRGYSISSALTANAFKKTGYTFAGWTAHRQTNNEWLYVDANGTQNWYAKGKQPEGYTKYIYADKASCGYQTAVNGDVVTLYAQWTPNKYYIAYNNNSGKGSMSKTTTYYDKKTTLSANKFTRSKYTFSGWTAKRSNDSKYLYTNANKTSTGWYKNGKAPSGWTKKVLADKEVVSKLTTSSGATVTMYAKWTKN